MTTPLYYPYYFTLNTILIAFVNVAIVPISPAVTIEYAHAAYLDGDARAVEFRWNVVGDGANYNVAVGAQNNVLVGQLSVPTHGYISWGLSPNGGMSGANMLVMWVDDDAEGVAHVQDRYATDFVEPSVIVDEKSSVVSYSGSQNATHTVVQFVRWIDAGYENEQGSTITSNSMHVIYAFGDADPDKTGHIKYHGPSNRGSQTLYLLDDTSGNVERDKAAARRDGVAYDYTAKNFSVPGDKDTLYWCTFHQLPEITTDTQMIGLEPIIDPKNIDMIHHFVVHMCDVDAFNSSSPPKVPSFACYETDLIKNDDMNAANCLVSDFWAWGVGGTGTYMPHNIGFRFSPRDSRRYFLLETHYNNPGLICGRVDNSGFRLILTDKIRPQQTSLLRVRVPVDESTIIPGNTPSFTVPTACHSTCTQDFVPPSGTRIFSVFLHSHLLGQSIALRHFRDGVELPPVLVDETYDFNYQQYRPTNSTLMPGDSLVLECNYSSTGKVKRSQATLGGLGTTQEMCGASLFVTPPIALETCSNAVNTTVLKRLMNTTDIAEPSTSNNTGNNSLSSSSFDDWMVSKAKMVERLKAIEWNSSSPTSLTMAKTLQDLYLNSEQTMYCKAGQNITATDGFLQPSKAGWKPYRKSSASSSENCTGSPA